MEKIVQGIDVKDCEYLYTDRDNDLCCAASIGGDSLCDPAQMMCNKYLDHLKKQIAPFKDKYFQGLDMEAIAELAKKSIRLATENRELEDENEKLKAQLEQQKKENEEFKEKLSQVKDTTEPLNSELPEDKVIREIFLIVNDCINKKVNPYKQALDEIEKQVKAINNECFYDASCDCNNCDMKNNCPYYRKVKTLDIINSVKDKNVPHRAKDGKQ